MARHVNHRLAKIHRNYTVDEVARRWGVHRNTVRQWIKLGLRTVDQRRPLLIHGRDLAEFLAKRRQANRRPCAHGEVYCVRCRRPRRPAGDMAEYRPLSRSGGNLVGLCPVCDCLMFRRVRRDRLEEIRAGLDVCLKEAPGHIGESR